MQLPWKSLHQPASRPLVGWPPSATQWLIGATASFSALWWVGTHVKGAGAVALALEDVCGLNLAGLAQGKIWPLLTHSFVESSPWGECLSVLGLYVAGRHLEGITGRRHIFQIYFLAGVLGGLAQILIGGTGQVAGGAAAVSALVFALTSVVPELELAPFGGFHVPPRLRLKHCAIGLVLVCIGLLVFAGSRGKFRDDDAVRCLVGCLVGWLYMRWLGFGRAEPVAAPPQEQLAVVVTQAVQAPAVAAISNATVPRWSERERRMTPRQYISEQVDPILDKIHLHGLAALTPEERRILEKGRDKIAQKDS